ncbi:helix-turn-helix transcriptional regulator [Shewanella xiamenensis]|uniref:helix-turn-helix domain-containing protein n=1 Tax=Shewanella xiamenensis TaxID=332186 RepID=UPI00313CF173
METSFSTILALTIKQIREDRKLTQSEVAELMGMSGAGWGKIENGQATLSIDNIDKFCKLPPISMKLSDLILKAESNCEVLGNNGWQVMFASSVTNDYLLKGLNMHRSLSEDILKKINESETAESVYKQLGSIFDAACNGAEMITKLFDSNNKR